MIPLIKCVWMHVCVCVCVYVRVCESCTHTNLYHLVCYIQSHCSHLSGTAYAYRRLQSVYTSGSDYIIVYGL